MKIAAALLFSAGFCIMWITCVYSAQIKFEYFYDQTVMEMFGDEVISFLSSYHGSTDNQIFFQQKVNMDKVRYDWGPCIYVGWIVACLEIITAGGAYFFRGFEEERTAAKEDVQAKDEDFKVLLNQMETHYNPRKSLALYQ